MRHNLKNARIAAGMTQAEIAKQLDISERFYRMIEAGERNGDFHLWDSLEDIFGIHQRVLRERSSDQVIKGDLE